MSFTEEQVRALFAHHPPTTRDRIAAHEDVREAAADLAIQLNHWLPESREKSLALTSLQQAAMWANAAIAIHETQNEAS
jgi:hypothetical protein